MTKAGLRRFLFPLLPILLVLLAPGISAAEPQRATHAVIFENDTIADTDRQYTNGLQYARMRPRDEVPPWAQWFFKNMTLCENDDQERGCHDARSGFFVGQLIYTPDDISIPTPILDDRPYAGWLYGGVSLDVTSRNLRRAHRLEYSIGVVGEESLAEDAQTAIHDAFNFTDPEGWEHQLDTKPSFEIEYEWTQSLFRRPQNADSRWFDLSLGLGGRLGNIVTEGHANLTGRIGWNISASLGNTTIQPVAIPPGKFELYFFFRARQVAVAWNQLIEGDNRFMIETHDDYDEVTTGIVFSWRGCQAAYNVVTRSAEFSPRELQHSYGSLRITWSRKL